MSLSAQNNGFYYLFPVLGHLPVWGNEWDGKERGVREGNKVKPHGMLAWRCLCDTITVYKCQ